MDTTEIVITSVFGVLLVAGLVFGLRQRSQVKDQAAGYAQRHGWVAIGDEDERLTGTACLAQHAGRARGTPVSIISRTPVAEKLLDDRVAVGGEEFRRRFTVLCKSAAEAESVVNAEVERLLLRHAEKPGWYVTVMIANRQVLAASFWAVKDEEWDYLIDLTRNLRAAVR